MRSLPAALLAAQGSGSALPFVRVVLRDRIGGVRRLAFTRLYTGEEPDGYHAAAMPGDGSLLRARVAGGRLYYQRAPDPAGGGLSSWDDLGPAANAGVALCAEGSRALLFFVDSDGVTLRVRESTDSGATLGGPTVVVTAAGSVAWLAADVKPSGDALLLYSVGGVVYAVRRIGGSWAAPAAWTNTAAAVTGLACYHEGDWNTVVCGADAAGDAFVWTCIYGDGFLRPAGAWSPLQEVSRANVGSGVTFRAPFLCRPDVYRLSFVEKYEGSTPYARPYHTYAPAGADYAANLWREPLPFDVDSEYGLALTYGAGSVWLSAPSGVWSAGLDAPELDVTDDVVELATEDRPHSGSCRIVLRNDRGAYSSSALLRPGTEVRVSPGYVTTAGPLVSDGPAYWIEGVERRTAEGEAVVVLEARDGWGLLGSWRARRQYAWAPGQENVFTILRFLLARAGLEFSATGAGPSAYDLYPAYTVHPGESAALAVRRLLAMVPDVILFRGEFAYLKEPLATEAVSYEYGTGHPLLAGRYGQRQAANRVQVFGRGVFAEGFDWTGLGLVGDRLVQVLDANITTAGAAQDRAAAVLRRAAIEADDGEITVAVNCGQELYDVVLVTDAGAGLAAASRRVLGITLRYSTTSGAYQQRITLGAP